MTPIDEDPQAPGASPQVLTFGAPTEGEVLAERYRLERHIGNDSLGRQLWRGSDVILQRPVTVVLRYPGGDSAAEMLSAAVAASRIVHPHLVGVYDAIDEGERAYVVREWVEGTSLRSVVGEYGPLEADKAVAIGHAIADAISALHDTGMAHGNIQPGTVLIGDDGRVVLADARSDEAATVECDIRAIGAVLYCALTGRWPHAEAGVVTVPDAARDPSGAVIAPHLIRAGVPSPLDELIADLLNQELAPPPADVLAVELARQDNAEDHRSLFVDESSGLDAFDSAAAAPSIPVRTGRKMAAVIAVLLVIAVAGTLAAARTLGGGTAKSPGANSSSTPAPGRTQGGGSGATPVELKPTQIRIVDPPQGTRTELKNPEKMIDGDIRTNWHTEGYNDPDFRGIKDGMGVLIDLGQEMYVSRVDLYLSPAGSTVALRGGATDPGSSSAGDGQVVATYQKIGEPITDAQTNVILPGDPDKKYRYLLVFFTKMPPDSGGRYRIAVQEIKVFGHS